MNAGSKRILVVEDDPAINTILTEFLRDEGYITVGVATGAEALQLLEVEQFQLITLDLGLPDMSGNDVLRELEQSKPAASSTTPVLIISANVNTLKSNSHVKGVVPKPFNLNDLMDTVQKLVN